MEISSQCFHVCGRNLKRYNKCNKKIAAYTVCILTLITLVFVEVLFTALSSDALTELYYYENQDLTLYIILVCCSHMILTTGLLLYGVLKNKSWCVLSWILTMIIYWNINLGATVISVVNYIMEGLEEEVEKTPKRTMFIFCIHAIWLFAVAYMWCYWKTLKEINNVANLIQYITERATKCISERRQRRLTNESINTSN